MSEITLIQIVVFAAGAVLMALEVLAFLLSARTFGTAYREITAVIAVFLLAMSLGYWLGGRWGDRWPQSRTLTCSTGAAGLLVAVIPWLEPRVAHAIFHSSLPMRIHSVCAVLGVYFAPVLLLAATSPIAVRLRARSLDTSGGVAGNVAAVSTAGSLAGTLVAGYWLIETFEVSRIILLLGGLMIGMAVMLVLGRRAGAAAAVMLLGLASPAWAQSPAATLVFEKQSKYQFVRVVDRGDQRLLLFNDRLQSTADAADPRKGFMEYTGYVHCAFLFKPDLRRVLLIGLGGGSIPKVLLQEYPDVTVDVAELDPVVVEVAKKFFGVKDDPRLKIQLADGRVSVKRSADRYDLIVVDAYSAGRYGLTVPRHLTTREFLQEAHDRLTADGMLLYNVASNSDNYASAMNLAMQRTAAAVFPARYSWEVFTTVNTMLFALMKPVVWTKDELLTRARVLVSQGRIKSPDFLARVQRLRTSTYPLGKAVLLTDQYAPVDQLMVAP